jgi:hypothetical protein
MSAISRISVHEKLPPPLSKALFAYHVLWREDFQREAKRKRILTIKQYEKLLEEEWLEEIPVARVITSERSALKYEMNYLVRFGKRHAPYGGRAEAKCNKRTLIHLATTALYRHAITGEYARWYNEARLKNVYTDLMNEICSGYAPDGLIDWGDGRYWGVELLYPRPGHAKEEYETKKLRWRRSRMEQIHWLRTIAKNNWKEWKIYDISRC